MPLRLIIPPAPFIYLGMTLDRKNLEILLQLLQECHDDEESVALLQTYLDEAYTDTWQVQAGAQGQQQNNMQGQVFDFGCNIRGHNMRDHALQLTSCEM